MADRRHVAGEKFTEELEAAWQEAKLGGRATKGHPAFGNDRGAIDRFTELRAARLCAWLRRREPLDVIGGAMLAYELSKDDLRDALEGPAPIDARGGASCRAERHRERAALAPPTSLS